MILLHETQIQIRGFKIIMEDFSEERSFALALNCIIIRLNYKYCLKSLFEVTQCLQGLVRVLFLVNLFENFTFVP